MIITNFGNEVLRERARELSKDEVLSEKIQNLIKDIRETLRNKKHGIGLAAPQIGENIRLTVIGIKSTPTRPEVKEISLVAINPEIVKVYGYRKPMWESCISMDAALYAQVPRYKKIRVKYMDEKAELHKKDIEGLLAHVFQHEIDHLNGVLFVDRVKDTKSYMTKNEYHKKVKKLQKQKKLKK